tara:strand:+ start:75 stop:317 length:243 start_codon:yes stop_codon:yes gene_type:complete
VIGVNPTIINIPIKNVIVARSEIILQLDKPATLMGIISLFLINCKNENIADIRIINGNNENKISGIFKKDIIKGKNTFEY